MLSFFPRDVLDESLDLIESVSEGFPTYSYNITYNHYLPIFYVYLITPLSWGPCLCIKYFGIFNV